MSYSPTILPFNTIQSGLLTENNKAIPPKVTEGEITTGTNEQGCVHGHNIKILSCLSCQNKIKLAGRANNNTHQIKLHSRST
jgi:hypothetical protein